MHITGYIWREDIIDKLVWKHNVQAYEVTEVLENRPQFERLERGHRPNEDLYLAAGQTASGRYLLVFFIRKVDGQALVVTAREMTKKERRRYAKK